jgi:hypothetical protein
MIANIAEAQFSGGVKLNLGMGGISSSNLEDNLAFQNNYDPKITDWTVDQKWGFNFGFGGFLSYSFSDHFSLLTEPTINFLQCGIDFTREDNNVDANGNGDIKTETTESDISLTYFSLPILARYEFSSKFYLLAGLGINFTGTPSINSNAFSQKVDYKNGGVDKTTIDPGTNYETSLNVFDSPRFDFVIGLGKTFEVSGKPLYVDLRYNLPLTQSEMFTTDPYYNDGQFKHNDLLGIDGKADAEKSAPYLLNDYKMSVLSLSVALTLFKK